MTDPIWRTNIVKFLRIWRNSVLEGF